MLTVPDFVGTLGVVVILFCYYLLQTRKLRIEDALYSWLNLSGAVLILYSLSKQREIPLK
jgi:hypothetical protein